MQFHYINAKINLESENYESEVLSNIYIALKILL